MDLSNYLRGVRDGVDNAAALADEDTKQVAARLATSVESSVQLALIEALADAANEISAELAPGSVGMTMRGLTPEFTVNLPDRAPEATYLEPSPADEPNEAEGADGDEDDDTTVRFSLRLPKWAKDKADKRAAEEGVSTNTWLAERVIRELSKRGRPAGPPRRPDFGPGPWGPGPERGPRGGHRGRGGHGGHGGPGRPGGPGGPGGPPFNPGDLGAMIDAATQVLRDWTGDKPGRRGGPGGRGRGPGGNVQGWV